VKARHNLGIAVICGAALWSAACTRKPAVDQAKLEVFKALPAVMDSASNPITEDKVNLGRMLYYDPRLSRGQDVSCNTCHELAKYGVDDEPFPRVQGAEGRAQRPLGCTTRRATSSNSGTAARPPSKIRPRAPS